MSAYGALAKVYDQLTEDVGYEIGRETCRERVYAIV